MLEARCFTIMFGEGALAILLCAPNVSYKNNLHPGF